PDMALPPIAAAWHVPPVESPDAGVAEETLLSAVRPPRSPSPSHGLGLPMPKTPFPGQKKPPCEARSEKAILGACWVVLEVRPPCGAAGYEHEGKCLRASFDAPREPTSEQP
ncbi:MAG: serine/threonine protein kinase, partial [Myxococcaceae bacterium]|nr:serine/threonine protein kinase [Myxococcaceae bacterium]